MLVESETCPCDKTVPEWLYHAFIGTMYPHRPIFLILSNLEEQRVLEGTNSSSSVIPISVTQARCCLSVQTISASRKYRDVQYRETMTQLSVIIRGTSASVDSPHDDRQVVNLGYQDELVVCNKRDLVPVQRPLYSIRKAIWFCGL
jgi:hypothetical protein